MTLSRTRIYSGPEFFPARTIRQIIDASTRFGTLAGIFLTALPPAMGVRLELD